MLKRLIVVWCSVWCLSGTGVAINYFLGSATSFNKVDLCITKLPCIYRGFTRKIKDAARIKEYKYGIGRGQILYVTRTDDPKHSNADMITGVKYMKGKSSEQYSAKVAAQIAQSAAGVKLDPKAIESCWQSLKKEDTDTKILTVVKAEMKVNVRCINEQATLGLLVGPIHTQ